MPRYNYTAKLDPQKTLQGQIEAATKQEAIDKLTQMGYFPISVEDVSAFLSQPGALRGGKISKKEIVLFSSQLSSLIDSGVNILNSLNIISHQTPNKYLKLVLDDVVAKIKDGKSLSDSLSLHPHIFSNLYTSLVRTGETSGSLKETIRRLADFLEKEEEFKNSLKASLTYPAFVFIVGVLTVVVLLVFVIPRLVGMFEDMGQALPLPTLILIRTSSFLRSYFWLILAAVFMLAFLLRRIYRSAQGKLFFDRFQLKAPIMGAVALKTEISRLMRSLSLLFASGVPITSSLEVAISVLGNQLLKGEVAKCIEEIAGGASFSSALKGSKFFPEFVVNIVSVGEETGGLSDALRRIADDYERAVDRALKELTRLLEPLIILFMGLVVGFIVLSMLLPIFQINLIAR
jgi:type II secretory pathway component PulF